MFSQQSFYDNFACSENNTAPEIGDSHGKQSVEIDDEVEAVVFRPVSAGSSLAMQHFQKFWKGVQNEKEEEDVEVETKERGEKVTPKRYNYTIDLLVS